ncbi:hypothetical protein CRV02_13365 [Arcobacter sp. CECT 8989]|uniref:hypothetical protein n=1 Tax=Arcobacter sp. CECT 8989 TaxID=2044509 RepID=UPI00100C071E|nr:hypothetical protein [Arcobacter sp. CECT 8989]RXJ98476.1 hypothetical protein CRV02_13365 [Arcobacter sp. CECT 8989]
MKLYVVNPITNKKEYLNTVANTKKDLIKIYDSKEIKIHDHLFSIEDVKAEINSETTAPSMVIGGAIGLFGGVVGVIAGGLIGGLLGNNSDAKDKQAVQRFNESTINE